MGNYLVKTNCAGLTQEFNRMGEEFIRETLALCLQCITMQENPQKTEMAFIEMVKNMETIRKKWLHAELELKKYKELLVKSDVLKATLEVKLKHARNQVDVEIKKRYKAEADYQYLQRQMQLMCDILVHDSKSNACLNDEQKSLLATFRHKGGNVTQHKSNKRFSVMDKSSFLSHSDISYDRTDDDMDLDATLLKPLKSRVREKRRTSVGPNIGTLNGRRIRAANRSVELLDRPSADKEVETTVVKASVTTPDNGGQIHMVIGITQEPQGNPRIPTQNDLTSAGDQTSVWMAEENVTEPQTATELETTVDVKLSQLLTATPDGSLKHVFQSKTVIRSEMCVPCGKRIRFGKMAMKCRDCRLIAHPECKQKCLGGCSLSTSSGTLRNLDSLERYAPRTHPRIPHLIVQCVKEIERRGLEERGIYRVPGGERLVKELREKYVQGKGPLMLSKVHEIHVVCGLLKDFLRKLKEPLITFRLHKALMEASEIPDENASSESMYRVIRELPKPNRDTLAFLMLHLQKVMQSPLCQMDQNNLARVFGPTIVGYGMADPSPMIIIRDTNPQAKVTGRLLSFPAEYWKNLLTVQTDRVISSVVETNICTTGTDRLFKPLTSPELNAYQKSNASNINKAKPDSAKKFFSAPTLWL